MDAYNLFDAQQAAPVRKDIEDGDIGDLRYFSGSEIGSEGDIGDSETEDIEPSKAAPKAAEGKRQIKRTPKAAAASSLYNGILDRQDRRQRPLAASPRMQKMQTQAGTEPIQGLGKGIQEEASQRAKFAARAQKLGAIKAMLSPVKRAPAKVASSPLRHYAPLSPQIARVGGRQRTQPSPLRSPLQSNGSRRQTRLPVYAVQKPVKKPQKGKRIGKAAFTVESSEDEQNASPSTSPMREVRQEAFKAVSEGQCLTQEEFWRNNLMVHLAILEELSKHTRILSQLLAKAASKQTDSPNSGTSEDADLRKKLNSHATTISMRLAQWSMYPGIAEIQHAVVQFLGCQTLSEAHQKHSLRDVSLLISLIEKRFSKVIRPGASSYIKTNLINVYVHHYPEMMRINSKGKKCLKRNILENLSQGSSHHCTIGGRALEDAYSCPAFRSLLTASFAKSLDIDTAKWEASQPITWLGRGQVAFTDCLVAWLLLGHSQIPKEGEEDYSLYRQMHEEALMTCDRAKARGNDSIKFVV